MRRVSFLSQRLQEVHRAYLPADASYFVQEASEKAVCADWGAELLELAGDERKLRGDDGLILAKRRLREMTVGRPWIRDKRPWWPLALGSKAFSLARRD